MHLQADKGFTSIALRDKKLETSSAAPSFSLTRRSDIPAVRSARYVPSAVAALH